MPIVEVLSIKRRSLCTLAVIEVTSAAAFSFRSKFGDELGFGVRFGLPFSDAALVRA